LKNNTLFCAYLSAEKIYENKIKEKERKWDEWTKAKIRNISPAVINEEINGKDGYIESYQKDFSRVIWLDNKLFAVGNFVDDKTPSQYWLVFRCETGRLFCKFHLYNEYQFLKSSS
jgi:hypothetical protein